MPYVSANGIRLAYERTGSGERVLLIMGQAAGGNVWSMYQVPALKSAGYEVITFDNRGMPPSDVPPGGYSLADLVADTAGLIEALDAGPCRLVGTSLGALVAIELAASRPDLVTCCVLMAVRARSDAIRRAVSAGEKALADSGIQLPAAYEAMVGVLQMFSPATLNDDAAISPWLDIYEMSAARRAAASGQDAIDLTADRRDVLRAVPVPCRVVGFSDDLMCPPHLCAEVAKDIPDCDYVEVGSCGHLGYLERPDEVNSAIVEFLGQFRTALPRCSADDVPQLNGALPHARNLTRPSARRDIFGRRPRDFLHYAGGDGHCYDRGGDSGRKPWMRTKGNSWWRPILLKIPMPSTWS